MDLYEALNFAADLLEQDGHEKGFEFTVSPGEEPHVLAEALREQGCRVDISPENPRELWVHCVPRGRATQGKA